jgi:hypothetical protein
MRLVRATHRPDRGRLLLSRDDLLMYAQALAARARSSHRERAAYKACLVTCSSLSLRMWRTDTANLAAFITVSVRPTTSVLSMDEAVSSGKSICGPPIAQWQRLAGTYPRARTSVAPVQESQLYSADKLRKSDGCDGVFTTLPEYRAWRTLPTYCNLVSVQTVFPQSGHAVPAAAPRTPHCTITHTCPSPSVHMNAQRHTRGARTTKTKTSLLFLAMPPVLRACAY